MHTFMQRVIPDTCLQVRGKVCLDLMALGKKLLGEYSKRWVLGSCSQEILKIIPTSTTSNLPGNSSPLKTQSSYLLKHQLWLGWDVWISPSSVLQDRLQWFLPQGKGAHFPIVVHSRGGHQSCFPIWFILNIFVRARKYLSWAFYCLALINPNKHHAC